MTTIPRSSTLRSMLPKRTTRECSGAPTAAPKCTATPAAAVVRGSCHAGRPSFLPHAGVDLGGTGSDRPRDAGRADRRPPALIDRRPSGRELVELADSKFVAASLERRLQPDADDLQGRIERQE